MAAHGGSAASSALKGLIQQFTAITGASESVGKHMLEACNNNLEMAVTMFLDGGGIAEEPSTSSASVSTVRPHTEEEVRAPIPQKQEILVEPEPLFGDILSRKEYWQPGSVSYFLFDFICFFGLTVFFFFLPMFYDCISQESLIDASEDSQLEAAIRASLQETHFDSTQTKQDSRSDEESESELFSGSEEFISVCGSDEEEEIENLAKSRKSPHKDLGHRKEENRRPLTEPPARTEPGTATNHQGLPPVDSEILEMSPEKSDGIVEGIDVNGPKAQLMLRYPDGKREQITLPEQAKLLALVKHVQSKGYPNERFELLTNFPRRKLSHLDYDITLQEAGLCPQETVFVQERN
ncbi:UBX domain-containing protein 7 isoform X1 [Canis lupus familiaris]|uniref:UBX domain-containing protein 7 isoform X1 n=1 Tax=Canis lupus familiaris TaxID=9615 RepID=UPI0018F7E441|nr:UBX domain-containing protein 7 isoform X1 [Canis lupus familiaris]